MTERELQALEQAAGFSLPLGGSDADSDGYGNRSAPRICALELEIDSTGCNVLAVNVLSTFERGGGARRCGQIVIYMFILVTKTQLEGTSPQVDKGRASAENLEAVQGS